MTFERRGDAFKSWQDAAEWLVKVMETYHESDQSTVSERSATATLHHDLEIFQMRLNATVNQEVRLNRPQSVQEMCDDVLQFARDLKQGEG